MARDGFNREIDYIRVSLTDRCNLRCQYCMPNGVDTKLQHHQILTYDEYLKILGSLAKIGIKKIKITGGEPLVRKDSEKFIVQCKKLAGIEKVTLTTNGTYLYDHIDYFLENGIDGINISLDTLNPDRFRFMSHGDLQQTLRSVHCLIERGYRNLKINVLIIEGFNDDEVLELALLAKQYPICVRFIELMPIGQGKIFKGVPRDYLMKQLSSAFGIHRIVTKKLGNGPADYITFNEFRGYIGFIDAIDHKFCETCNRVRLTSTGKLKLCLQYNDGIDLSPYAKGQMKESEFLDMVLKALQIKPKENKFKDLDSIKNENDMNMNMIGG